MNDLELAQQIAAGDGEASEKLVRDHYASVYRSMRHLTGKREDAEDLTQQVFLAARSRIHTFRGAAGLKTWIHRIAFNEYAQWKRRRRNLAPLKIDQPIVEPGYEALILGESLLTALRALPDKLRETFLLHEVEELKVEEVAQILGLPSGTVKARLFYARRRLRTLLEDETQTRTSEKNSYENKEAIV